MDEKLAEVLEIIEGMIDEKIPTPQELTEFLEDYTSELTPKERNSELWVLVASLILTVLSMIGVITLPQGDMIMEVLKTVMPYVAIIVSAYIGARTYKKTR